MLTKLLFRTLPEYYPSDSAYAHFPFMVPVAMQQAMQKRLDPTVHDYDWSRPTLRPVLLPPIGTSDDNSAGDAVKLYQDRVKKMGSRAIFNSSSFHFRSVDSKMGTLSMG